LFTLNNSAFALLLLLEAHKKTRQGDYSLGAVEVIGITCVSGNIHLGGNYRGSRYGLHFSLVMLIVYSRAAQCFVCNRIN